MCNALENLRCFCNPEKNRVDFTGYPSNHFSGCRLNGWLSHFWLAEAYLDCWNIKTYFASIAAIYAGGLSCGLYTTNSPLTTKYICETAPLDILVVQDIQMLEKMLQAKLYIPSTLNTDHLLWHTIKSWVIIFTFQELWVKKHS